MLLFASGKIRQVMVALRSPKQLLLLALAAVLIGLNWLLFIWAVANDHILDASLGYYINPLLNVAIGVLFFAERLRRLQLYAIGLAITGGCGNKSLLLGRYLG